MEYISIGKILNFHGIKGEAKIGFSNENFIKNAKVVFADKKALLTVSSVRFHKNFAIVKFKEINSINELLEFKGKNIYLPKETVQKNLEENEFLIDDLIGLNCFDNEENFIGTVFEIQKSIGGDLLAIKSNDPEKKDLILVPFVSELVPIVDIENQKIIIKPIEGLL